MTRQTFKPVHVLTEHLPNKGLVALAKEAVLVPLRAILVIEHDGDSLPLPEVVLVRLLADPGLYRLDRESLALGKGLGDADVDGALGVRLVVDEEGAEVKGREM